VFLRTEDTTLRLPELIGEPNEKGTYGRTSEDARRWDHLPGETLKVAERSSYSKAWGNAQDRGKGRRGGWTSPTGAVDAATAQDR
jgi:hypothetical protein